MDSSTCSMCWCKIPLNENRYISKKCQHIFHQECMEKWSKKCIEKSQNITCPVCRKVFRVLSLKCLDKCNHDFIKEVIHSVDSPKLEQILNVYKMYVTEVYTPNIYWVECWSSPNLTSVNMLLTLKDYYIYEHGYINTPNDYNESLIKIFDTIMDRDLDLNHIVTKQPKLYISILDYEDPPTKAILYIINKINQFVEDEELKQNVYDNLPKKLYPFTR